MIEILPIRLLADEDSPIFGKLNVALGKLSRLGFPVGAGFAVTGDSCVLVLESGQHIFADSQWHVDHLWFPFAIGHFSVIGE